MKTCLSRLLVWGVLCLAFAALPARTAHAAKPLQAPLVADRANSTSSVPLWVSARVAFGPDGKLRTDLFTASSLRILNNNLSKNFGSDCREALGSPPLEDFVARDSFDDLVAGALSIIEGHVISTDTGFLNGIPGTLVSIQPAETYKSNGHLATQGNIHVFVGEATIPTRTGVICSRTFSNVPTPAIGDDVVVFASVDPMDTERRILVLDERKQLVVHHLAHLYRPLLATKGDAWPAGCCADLKDLGFRLRENKHLHDVPARIRQ
jgi:hypothetical protein